MYLSFSLHSFGVGCLVFIVQADGRGPGGWRRTHHKVDRVLSRPNWDPLTRRRVCLSPLWFGGGGVPI
jgi:hypothetical protein